MASTNSGTPKKVRSACRRCRVRRIKCDGHMPSCGNCSKAGEPCIDVDSQNQDILIPRNFASAARARILWLEEIISKRLPDIDLKDGPQIDISGESRQISVNANQDFEPNRQATPMGTSITASDASTARNALKRSHDVSTSSDNEETLPKGAQSVAFNLGMLSLNSDSSQKHYLGSSSGLLFSNLIAASPSSTGATQDAVRNAHNQPALPQALAQLRFKSLQDLLKQQLPRKEDALVLVQTYVRENHPEFPLLDPQALFVALEALYECALADLEDTFHNDWPFSVRDFRWNGREPHLKRSAGKAVPLPVISFILFMIFNIAAIDKVRARVYEFSPEKFYRAALLFSKDCFSQISISSTQAIVMLIIHSILTPSEVNMWTLIHIAMAQTIEIGIHREPQKTAGEDKNVQQINRFVFYTIYSLDRSVSTIQGRPLGFRDETFDVKMPEQLEMEPDTDETLVPAALSAAFLRYSTHIFKLDRIVSDIKLNLYHLPFSSSILTRPANPEEHQKRIISDLQSWWGKIPENELGILELENRQMKTWFSKLKVRYHTTMILLHQPSQSIPKPTDQALLTCFSCATSILQIYQILSDHQCLQYGWRTVQNIFAAGATLIYTFWTCTSVQLSTSIIELSKSLRVCSSLLSIGGEWWPSLKMGKNSLETVSDLTIRKLSTLNAPAKQRRMVSGSPLEAQSRRDVAVEDQSRIHIASTTAGMQMTSSSANLPMSAPASASMSNEHTSQFSACPPQWQHASIEQDLRMQEAWEMFSTDYSAQTQSSFDITPEIEDFLADFNTSEFSWNFPLNALEGQPGDEDFFDSTYGMG